MTSIESLKNIEDVIDRKRRDAVQASNSAQGEVSHMYYEGMAQGLANAQAYIQMFALKVFKESL